MALGAAPVVLAGFALVLAAAVLAARPAGRLNRVVAALLALRGATTLAYAASRAATDATAALAYARMAHWYTIPVVALLVALLAELFLAPSRARRALVGGAALLAAVVAVLFALEPTTLTGPVVPRGPGFAVENGPVLYALTATATAAETAIVLLAARATAARTRTATERRRAALVGLAFAVFIVYAGSAFVPLVLDRALGFSSFTPLFLVPATAALVALAAVAPALPRLARELEPRGRRLAWAVLLAVVLAGLLDGVAGPLALRGVTVLPRYDNALLLVRAASMAILALALVRHGLAGFGDVARDRLASAALAGVAVAVALAAGGVALALAGVTATGLLVAPLVGLGALLLSPVPLRAAARDLARRVLASSPAGADAGERVRLYAAALARGAGEAELARLRTELGVTVAEHAALAAARADAPRVLGRYAVVRELGRGAFGTAELARDAATGREVVLKRFHGGRAAASAAREARALAAVAHPRIVPFLDVDRVGDEVVLVMGYAPGGSVRALLDREGPLDPARAAAVARDALEGLAALHAAGLVHRDVKPENLLIGADGRAMLGDFGSARFLAADANATLTGAGVAGSLSTVAPEVLRGAPGTPAADVYAVGAVLYRLLTGEHYVALDGADAFEARERVLRDPPRLPHGRVPAAIEPVLARALAKRPEERFPDASAMASALTTAGTRGAIAPP